MGGYDSDGLRVDERVAGSINTAISGSQFIWGGAESVELDEGQEGSVMLYTNNSKYNNNGKYCDPDVMKPFVPSEDEGVGTAHVFNSKVIDGFDLEGVNQIN